ncbi:MAG: bifunctional 4-hydroxy-2-oxoglutarate aldolase/2-dehydro-3-deoxy-phosphogluconate aldolase [Pseudomonadota bacterium]
MDWARTLSALEACPVVPVLSVDRIENAAPLARALFDGGITVSEITLRTDAGLPSVAIFKQTCPNMLVGAGTVLDAADLAAALDHGSDFIVSPGFDAGLLSALAECPVPVMPGVATPGEAMAARNAGITRVKLFPAGIVGGAAMIKGMGGPLQDMGFMPTGGVTLDNLGDYLALANVYAVGGTWIAKAEDVAAGDWTGITARARAACEAAKALRG